MRYTLFALAFAFVPVVAFAGDTIITFIDRGTGFLSGTVIGLLLAVALITFLWNAMRYFVLGGGDEKGREKAKRLALYGISAFVLIIILWAIVNLIVNGLGFTRENPLQTDFRQGYRPSIDP